MAITTGAFPKALQGAKRDNRKERKQVRSQVGKGQKPVKTYKQGRGR